MRVIRILIFSSLILCAGVGSYAQPVLNFKRLVNNWPTVEIFFSTTCNGLPAYFTDKRYFKVYENGLEVGEFELWCPDPTVRCAISVAMVFDASLSMNGSGVAGAQAAGHAFVDLMDGATDEACVIMFNQFVVVSQPMTVYRDLLHAAIDNYPTALWTNAWDGLYTGINNVINDGVNPCRAVILLTDGYDTGSQRSPGECISLAMRNRIRVFTIGLGNNPTPAVLQNIADQTGGKYYESPNASQLTAIYQEISSIIFQGFQECLITYQAKCMDGGMRKVDLSILNFCNGSDTKTKSFKAPKDTSTYRPLNIRLGTREGRGNQDVKVPLELTDPITPPEIFYGATFTIKYDESCLQFKDIETPPGSVLENVPIIITPLPGTVTFQIMDKKVVEVNDVPAMLAELRFRTSDPDGKDTVCCDLQLISWVFEAGCFRPVLQNGKICIIPRQPEVHCELQMPQTINWERGLKDYNPNPFPVTAALSNIGDRDARNVRFKIEYNKNDLSLVAPVNNVQNGVPKDLKPSGISEGRWDVLAKRRTVGDSVNICIVAAFDNHDSVRCCKKVWVPSADAVLSCSAITPEIKADRVNTRYNPMPFDITVTVTNEGGKKSDSVFARIIVPADLRLYGPDAPNRNTKRVLPAILNPGQSGGVSWTLWHPITLTTKDYLVGIWVRTSNADSSYCEVKVIIPPLEAPVLAPTCRMPDSLHFEENISAYVPNPFQVSLGCVNRGGLPATNVTGFIYLPANTVLANPTEPLRKSFPSPMNEWTPGDPFPAVTWDVTYTKKLRYDTYLDFKFVVGGVGPTGLPTDSVESWCRVRVPGLQPSFACDISMPDSISLNATETDVEPNPFDVTYRVWNTSKQTATIATVTLQYPFGEGLTVSPGTPVTRNVNRALGPNDTLSVTWTIAVQNRITRRLVRLTGVAYDDEGNPVICPDDLPIANLRTSLVCDVQTDVSEVVYYPVLQEYAPKEWVIASTLTNTGGAPITNVEAEIELRDSSLVGYLAEFNPGFADNSNPKTIGVLFPASSQTFQWGFRLSNPNQKLVPEFLNYTIKYKSKETPPIDAGCETVVEIKPVVMPKLECALLAPDTIYFNIDTYEPSPFDLKIQIRNVGSGDAYNVKAFVLQGTRFNILPPASRDYGDLPPGRLIDFDDESLNTPFRLRVNPRDTDGFDTIRVVVISDGIPSATCEFPVWVQREQRPRFTMTCVATPDRLTFDDQLNDYVPNPFTVVTTVVNTGDTRAENCQLLFVGPPRFTPDDNTPIVNVGTMPKGIVDVGDTVTHSWRLVPLRRTLGGWDELVYQIQGRGGLGNRLIIGECRVPVYVPPARAAEYQLACDAPDAIQFDNASGTYIPDPFQFKVNVRNAGLALGQNLEITAMLPPGLIFTSGETATKQLGDLAPNGTTQVIWLVKPIANTTGVPRSLMLCARVVDKLGKEGECCDNVVIAAATKAALSLSCEAEFRALVVDHARGEYEKNPIWIAVKVRNDGDRPAHNVRVVCLPQSNEVKVLGDPERFVALRLDPKQSTDTIRWEMYAIPRVLSGDINIQFVVTADDLPSTDCITPVFIPEVGRPVLTCGMESSMKNTNNVLTFDYSIGDYRDDIGTKGSAGNYNVFTVTARLQNIGAAQAHRLRATLLLPEGVSLDAGETGIKDLGNLLVQGSASVSWNIVPQRQSADALRHFAVRWSADNIDQTTPCAMDVTIEGAPKIVRLRLPQDNVGRFGEKITVPVYVDTTIGKDIFTYKINVKFDPEVVRFVDAVSMNTLTARGWTGPRGVLYRESGLPDTAPENIVRIEDFTTGSPLNVRREGILVGLVFEAVYNGGEKSTGIRVDSLTFIDSIKADIAGSEKVFVSSMNSIHDDSPGKEVRITFENGLITIAGYCIVPLVGGSGYNLAQNTPNPFNPSTVIEYEIGDETAVKLVVFDQLGREVATLVNTKQKAGKYAYIFDASVLASGTYVYRLDAGQYSKTLRMVLAR
ncbi:MAG: VWA domain-containing protein [Ignavibacteriae bacterium]|nr:VWA domain-containing protein [Ignavibacteriota bacterium]